MTLVEFPEVYLGRISDAYEFQKIPFLHSRSSISQLGLSSDGSKCLGIVWFENSEVWSFFVRDVTSKVFIWVALIFPLIANNITRLAREASALSGRILGIWQLIFNESLGGSLKWV